MLKPIIAVVAFALAGTAGAAGWRDLRIDASSEPAFRQSLDTFKKELSPERQQVFTAALTDIWLKGTEEAKAAQREFTADDYYRQIDGLGYEEVVTYTDPTGDTAKKRYRDATQAAQHAPAQAAPVSALERDGAGRWGTDPTRAETERAFTIGACRSSGDVQC